MTKQHDELTQDEKQNTTEKGRKEKIAILQAAAPAATSQKHATKRRNNSKYTALDNMRFHT